ncbi:hypothetical protein DL766_004754 [Monosporascus sp. MC13-8B]|uniref:C2H2-type domain-containing protein n=1 Tax=Monosporascus cannonballus TaxID=155416 RepID=A0ABY0H5Q3_9PEZI|nr:hypothetical protein DL762_006639 [Monosporascus cannonballus]RYO88486.1 hypothetical protein DL763_005985 [Monosporascus cannonballus]RYP30742.1 hypothetical protein DL766_004754 [Monosporascus sp. MC13-8B]
MELDKARIEQYQRQLREDETPEPEPWRPQELENSWARGNARRPLPPNHSDNHKVSLYRLQQRWLSFCERMGRRADWKALLKTLTFDNKGLGESFIRYLMRDSDLRRKRCTINSENSIRVYTRRLGGLYKKYTAEPWDDNLRDHLRQYAKILITPKWKLRREPKAKPIMGPDFFIYHIHFLWTRAEPFFSTKLNQPSIKIKWKREWLHRPVFRRTLDGLGTKSNEPLTAATFDSHSIRLGVAMGLLERFTEYAYRGGFANCVDENYRQSVRDQGLRHRPNGTIYQEAYHNANCNAVVQDAFLGRGTATPYLSIFNHMGLRRDENAPKVVSDELMCAIGPSSDVRRLEEEVKKMKADLEEKQKHRRKVFKMIYKDHFDAKDEEELQKQLQGIREPEVKREVQHVLQQRTQVADILSDMDDAIPQQEIVQRKVEAINAWVAYAFVCEPVQRNQPKRKQSATGSSGKSDSVLPGASSPRQPPTKHALPASSDTPTGFAHKRSLPLLPKPSESVQPPNGICSLPNPSLPRSSSNSQRPLDPIATDVAQTNRQQLATLGKTAPCIFCGKRYARQALLWDHLEKRLRHVRGAPIHCPQPECKSEGVVLEDIMKFKAHAARLHGTTFRRIKIVTSRSQDPGCCAQAPPKLKVRLISSRESRPPPQRPRIVIVSQSLDRSQAI